MRSIRAFDRAVKLQPALEVEFLRQHAEHDPQTDESSFRVAPSRVAEAGRE
jgi:hypothetical protein